MDEIKEVKELKQQLDQAMQAYINRGQTIAQLQTENSRLESTVFQLQKQNQTIQEELAKLKNDSKPQSIPPTE